MTFKSSFTVASRCTLLSRRLPSLLVALVMLFGLVCAQNAPPEGGEYMNAAGPPQEYQQEAPNPSHPNPTHANLAAMSPNGYAPAHVHPSNYHGRQSGLTSASSGMINLLPVAFVAGFGLLLLIPLLFIFFSTGFGPSFGGGYGGYAGRKRSFDDFVSPFVNHLHPMLANVAKHPIVTELWKGVDAHTLLDSLNLLPKSSSAQAKSNSTLDSTTSLIKSLGNLLAPLFKDLLPADWRKMLIQFVGRSASGSGSAPIDKGPHYKTN
jgi:hypothetical protein